MNSSLWVGNLSGDVTEAELTNLFGKYGAIVKITLYSPKYFAFVHFKLPQDAKSAKDSLNATLLRGSPLKIDFAKPEWVCASKLADPDKLSLRHSGRPIIRPCPPEEPSRQFFEVGTAVEAWWNNGWWESFILTGVSLSSNNDKYHVFLPGKCKFLDLHGKDLRVAKDWIGNTWVAVNPQPDILSVIQLCLEQREE